MYHPPDKFYIILTFTMKAFTLSLSNYSEHLSGTPSYRCYLGEDHRLLESFKPPKVYTKIEADTAIHKWQSHFYRLSVEIEKVKDEHIGDTN